MYNLNDDLDKTMNHKMLVFELVTGRYKADKLSITEGKALEAAAKAIEYYHGETQDCRILLYVARNSPYAFLYRDAYSMRALNAGLQALQRKEEELRRRCKETNSLYKDACRLLTTT